MLSDLDVAVTHGINSSAGQAPLIEQLTVWTSAIAVPLVVAAVALQWWCGDDKPHTRHVLVATGFSFLLGPAFNQVLLLVNRLDALTPNRHGVTKPSP